LQGEGGDYRTPKEEKKKAVTNSCFQRSKKKSFVLLLLHQKEKTRTEGFCKESAESEADFGILQKKRRRSG